MEYIRSGHYDIVRNDYGRQMVIPSEKEWAEVKRGKWEDREVFDYASDIVEEWQSERCSECNKYLTTPYRYYLFHHNYCPYCGARMEASDD